MALPLISYTMESPAASEVDMASYQSKGAPLSFSKEDGPSDTKDKGLVEKLKNFGFKIVTDAFKKTLYHIQLQKRFLDGEKEGDSKIRRFAIGKRDPQKPNKTILLVGETGTGKSTFIDAMGTHLMGTTYEDKAWCKIIDEEPKMAEERKAESQTKTVTVYDIFGLHDESFPYSLTIIDTPGFGDTRDDCEDEKIMSMLHGLLILPDGVKQVDAVCLVLKEGTNRLSDRQRYVFNDVVSLLGKDLEKNLVALITHSSGITPTNDLDALEEAGIKLAKDENNEPYYFLINNCHSNDNSKTAVNKRKIKQQKARETAWETSKDGMEELLAFLKTVTPQDLTQTAEVLRKQIQIEACCSNLMERIEYIEMKRKEIQQKKEAVEKLENEADSLATPITVDEPYKALEKISGWWDNKATRCTTCQENCHYPGCIWAWGPSQCEVIKGGKCISCTGKCDYSSHVKDKMKYVNKTKKVTKTVDYKKKCEIGEKKTKKEVELAKLETDLESNTKMKEDLVEEIYQCFVQLDQITLMRVSVYTYSHLEYVIKKLDETSDNDRLCKMILLKKSLSTTIGQPAIDYGMPHLKKQSKAAATPQQKDGDM